MLPTPPTPSDILYRRLIKQDDLKSVVDLRLVVEAMKRDSAAAEIELAKAESVIIARIDAGTQIEPGAYSAAIHVTPGRRSPKWKEALAARCGPRAVVEVTARTEPGPPSRKLMVTEAGS